MKKTLYGIAFLFLSAAASAEVVSSAEAEAFAKRYFASDRVVPVNVRTAVLAASDDAEPAAFHAFNNEGGGWIIVAGDDLASPVLAYSPSGSIDAGRIRENSSMSAWLATVRSGIASARAKNIRPVASFRARSSGSTLTSAYGSSRLLETPLWGQGSPFNDLCPYDGSSRSVSGCVATAMSIVLRYNMYPAHGTGDLASYQTITNGISVQGYNIDNHYYDWNSMPYQYTSSSSSQSRQAVAQLVHDCGVMVQMDYTASGSGAFSEDVVPALVAHMGYSTTAKCLTHASFSNEQWLSLIVEEIDNNRPILYSGQEVDGGGHEFVCDGYDAAGNVHINWGWNGSCNGFFSVSYLGDGNSGVFSNFDDMVVGLKPATPSDPPAFPNIQFYGDGGVSVEGEIVKGIPFTVDVTKLANLGDGSFSGSFHVCLVDRDNKVKEVISDRITVSGFDSYTMRSIRGIECKVVSSDIKPDDGIVLAYEWNGEEIIADAGLIDEVMPNFRCGVMDVPIINVRENVRQGENLYFDILPGRERIKSVTWYFDGIRKTKGYVIAPSGSHTVKAEVEYYYNGGRDVVTRLVNIQ